MAIEVTGDSKEAVAYALMRDILASEGKVSHGMSVKATRQDILDTYRECLRAVQEASP